MSGGSKGGSLRDARTPREREVRPFFWCFFIAWVGLLSVGPAKDAGGVRHHSWIDSAPKQDTSVVAIVRTSEVEPVPGDTREE
jgi:hypothetical protein